MREPAGSPYHARAVTRPGHSAPCATTSPRLCKCWKWGGTDPVTYRYFQSDGLSSNPNSLLAKLELMRWDWNGHRSNSGEQHSPKAAPRCCFVIVREIWPTCCVWLWHKINFHFDTNTVMQPHIFCKPLISPHPRRNDHKNYWEVIWNRWRALDSERTPLLLSSPLPTWSRWMGPCAQPLLGPHVFIPNPFYKCAPLFQYNQLWDSLLFSLPRTT